MNATARMLERAREAARRLRGHANRTPVLTSRTLNERVGASVFLKCENFQRVGAFKFRGAFNAISSLPDEQRRRGVITHSSGNHAQAVALVGKLLGVQTTVVMPNNAPAIKLAATRGYGATVIGFDPKQEKREAISARLARAHGYTLVPPFDHVDVIAGQATAALELFEQAPDLDMLLVPCGGGGLLSGCAVAASVLRPACRVIGIEPAVADDAVRSFRTGKLHRVENPPTIADGTRNESLGEITFALIRAHVADMQTVSEEDIKEAVRFLFYRTKLVVEPSGALGVAALLAGAVPVSGRVGVMVSGGNIDADTLCGILTRAAGGP